MAHDKTSFELHFDAFLAALADAAMDFAEVDGLITCGSMIDTFPRHAVALAEHLGILSQLSFCQSIHLGGSSSTAAIGLASDLVKQGRCKNVAIVTGEAQLSGLTRNRAVQEMAGFRHDFFEAPFGPSNPSCFALLATRHMHEHGTTSEDLATVAVVQRRHAGLTAKAHQRAPLTVDEVLSSKMISSPFHLFDCSLISDGGAAVIVSGDAGAKGVTILGHGDGYARHDHISEVHSLGPEDMGAAASGARAFAAAGLSPQDVDVAMLYDCFTITPMLLLEHLGLCPEGQSKDFVRDGGMSLGSSLPVNTHGGLLSYAHSGYPSTMFGVVEACRQLRHECDERQVAGASTALVHGLGGMFSCHSTVLLGG
ncbi:hypothetical protein CFI00_17250 [Nocardioides sp. S5]|nr:hypothetical protein CFI00_17250 [Nocardioides sp. S5]